MNSNTKLVCALVFLCACSSALLAQGPCGGKPCGAKTSEPTGAKPRPRSASPKTKVEPPRGSSASTVGVEVTTPSGLKYVDLVVGSGESPRKGQTVTAEYTLRLANGGPELESTLGRPPFQFRIGTGSVIKGWDEGVMTMKVDGTRRLIIPANLAYGAAGRPPDIPPEATLIFQVTLLSVKSDNAARSGPRVLSAPATAELTIRTTPANTLILIDGQDVGFTGDDGMLNLPKFKPGEHLIVARRERYRDAQRTIMLEATSSQVAQLDLSPTTGTLNVTVNISDTQIEIAEHGSYTDKVSNLELDPGSYSITASKPGYQLVTKSVEITAGSSLDLALVLEPGAAENPQLAFAGRENYLAGGQSYTRYKLIVTNSATYSPDMFASAPELPPCGRNTKSSRTWVDVYDQRGTRLYGFCAFTKTGDLGQIWFALPTGQPPPSVFIVLNDRLKGKEYKSNLVAIP